MVRVLVSKCRIFGVDLYIESYFQNVLFSSVTKTAGCSHNFDMHTPETATEMPTSPDGCSYTTLCKQTHVNLFATTVPLLRLL